jgi:hypothetical protein
MPLIFIILINMAPVIGDVWEPLLHTIIIIIIIIIIIMAALIRMCEQKPEKCK